MISWDDLRSFLAVVQTGSYVAASKKLGVDRTTVSRRVDALEKSLGSKLFTQVGKEFQSTEVGHAVLSLAERLEAEISALQAFLNHKQTSLEGSVKLAVSSSFGDAFIGDIMAFHQLHPLITIEVINVGDPMSAVISRQADLGICAAYDQPARLDSVSLGILEVAVYGAAGHINSNSVNQNWVGWSDDIPKSFMGWMSEYTPAHARIGTRVNSWEALKTAVLSGAGVAPIWCMLAETEPRLIRISEPVASHSIGLWLTSLEGLKREAPQQAVWNFLFRRIQQKN